MKKLNFFLISIVVLLITTGCQTIKDKTDFRTEVIAGTTTFLTMAYIMFLNPFILSGEFAGPEKGFFDFGAVYTATILATALACFIMAFYGKTWPIGLAPGMGINLSLIHI